MSLVSSVRIRKEAVEEAILESLNLIGYSFPKDVKNIVIKPNLCYYWDYTTGQTTDPKFTAALINVIREKISSNTNISIIESDASAMKCKHAFKMLSYEKLAQDYNVRLVNISEDTCTPTKVSVGHQSFTLMFPDTIKNADLRINIPKIKYAMEPIKITCALKNIFGCNPYPKKFRYHSKLGEAIVALNKAMKFDLCIVDGNIVSGIQPRKLGLVMASKDPVATDTAAAIIAGVDPRTISYLQLARNEGLGKDLFVPKGEPITYFRDRYPRKNANKKLLGKIYSLVAQTPLVKRLGLQ
jgi:uncharacterized protein (DUF362 family)